MPGVLSRTGRSATQFIPRPTQAPTNRGGNAVRRVLIADPCADTVALSTLLLRLWGHDVRGVGTGPEALEAARTYRPDTVLMEIALPGLDGFEVARRLRQQHGGPE